MKNSSQLSSRVETITPQIAHELIATKERPDRNVNPVHIRNLAGDMRLGLWTVNGESVKINADGEVIDGQHRLRACILADIQFDTLVVRNLSTDNQVRFGIDSGRRRNAGDALMLQGVSNTKDLAAAASHMWRFLVHKMDRSGGPTVSVALKLVDRFGDTGPYQGLKQSVMVAKAYRSAARKGGLKLPVSLVAWGHYTFGEIDRRKNGNDDVNTEFWNGVILGMNLSDGDPRLTLRNRLLKHSVATTPRDRLGSFEVRAFFVKAWNAYSDGRALTKLAWIQVGPYRQQFPTVNDVELLADWFRIRL